MGIMHAHTHPNFFFEACTRLQCGNNDEGGDRAKGGGLCGEGKLQTSLITVVGIKKANHFHTVMCFVAHKLGRG